MVEAYPAVALALILAGWFVVHGRRRKRLAEATRLAAAELGGTYEPGGYHSGGTITGRVEGAEVVVTFHLGNARRSPATTAIVTMAAPRQDRALTRRLSGAWTGASFGQALMARLAAARVRSVRVHSNLVSVQVARVLRDRGSIVELASIAAAAAAEAVDAGGRGA
jgi:hypothetical protein